MLENLHFTYDGQSSKDFGVMLVNPNGGMYKESFLPNRKIIETKVAGRDVPFFQRVDNDPLSFVLNIYIQDWKERNNLRAISRWLFKPYYKELRFEYNPDIVYYAMIEGNNELNHDGQFNGYITLTVRMSSPYRYSPIHKESISLRGYVGKVIYNNGDLPMRFDMKIVNVGTGNVRVRNNNTREEFIITDLVDEETIYVDSNIESIVSSLENEGKYAIDNHNDVWLTLEAETNAEFDFFGYADIEITYQYTYLNVDNELWRGGFCN